MCGFCCTILRWITPPSEDISEVAAHTYEFYDSVEVTSISSEWLSRVSIFMFSLVEVSSTCFDCLTLWTMSDICDASVKLLWDALSWIRCLSMPTGFLQTLKMWNDPIVMVGIHCRAFAQLLQRLIPILSLMTAFLQWHTFPFKMLVFHAFRGRNSACTPLATFICVWSYEHAGLNEKTLFWWNTSSVKRLCLSISACSCDIQGSRRRRTKLFADSWFSSCLFLLSVLRMENFCFAWFSVEVQTCFGIRASKVHTSEIAEVCRCVFICSFFWYRLYIAIRSRIHHPPCRTYSVLI